MLLVGIGAGLPPTPVGTSRQNLQTVVLYAICLVAAAGHRPSRMAPSTSASALMSLSRRNFIGLTLAGAAGVLVPGCTDGRRGTNTATGPSALQPPAGLAASPAVADSTVDAVQVSWSGVPDAQSYDIELNGLLVARSSNSTQFAIAPGDGRTGLTGGANSVRVRGRAGDLEGPWSTPAELHGATHEGRAVEGLRL